MVIQQESHRLVVGFSRACPLLRHLLVLTVVDHIHSGFRGVLIFDRPSLFCGVPVVEFSPNQISLHDESRLLNGNSDD